MGITLVDIVNENKVKIAEDNAIENKAQIDPKVKVRKNLFKSLTVPVYYVNEDFVIIDANEAFLYYTKYKKEDLVGKVCFDVLNLEHYKSPYCDMRNIFKGNRPIDYTGGNLDKKSCNAEFNGMKTQIDYIVRQDVDDDDVVLGAYECIIDASERFNEESRVAEQRKAMREMATPTIELWEGVLILPIVGIVDSIRAQQMLETVLGKISDTRAKVLIFDIQGVAAIDTAVANHIIKIFKAAELMGCMGIISGVSPVVAQTVVNLGIDINMFESKATLEGALKAALTKLNFKVTREV